MPSLKNMNGFCFISGNPVFGFIVSLSVKLFSLFVCAKINEPIVIGNFLCYSKLNYFGQLYPKITCEEAVQALKRRGSPAKPFATLLFGIWGVMFRFVGGMN